MCRNIRTLFNFEPPATDEEIRAAAEQFIRKISGFTRPSKANERAFMRAVEETASVARRLIDSLETQSAPRNRVPTVWLSTLRQRLSELALCARLRSRRPRFPCLMNCAARLSRRSER